MNPLVGRRHVLAGAGAAFCVGALDGCGVKPVQPDVSLPPLHTDLDRITQITVCTRPFRAEDPRLDVETIGAKTVVHNYGHGGSGWSLSWGSSAIAIRNALATGERDIAVIGCGAMGLTSAILAQRGGAKALFGDSSLTPVRGQLARMVPEKGVEYGLYHHHVSFLPRRDGWVFQLLGQDDYYGYGDETAVPDRAEAETAIRTIAGLFTTQPTTTT